MEKNCLVIRPIVNPREGWGEAFQKMAANGDDTLADESDAGNYLVTSWDEEEWQWQ